MTRFLTRPNRSPLAVHPCLAGITTVVIVRRTGWRLVAARPADGVMLPQAALVGTMAATAGIGERWGDRSGRRQRPPADDPRSGGR